MLRDISELKVGQKRNAEFVSAVSHEMKTPLSGHQGLRRTAGRRRRRGRPHREEFLDVINGQADRLQRLIDNLLNLARIEAGVVKVTKESISLNELLDEAR